MQNLAARISQKLFTKAHPVAIAMDFIFRTISGQSHLPPLWLRDVGPSDFETTGQEFLDLFIKLAKLRPDEEILDIGSGCGRMAFPLIDYLSPAGSYVGMDITLDAIVWCQQHIAPGHNNFQFVHANLFNRRYNPLGEHQAETYAFPFEDKRFDFIFLTSVFTHMLPDGVENYLREIARLLRSDGRALMTFFLLNETQQALTGQKRNDIDFKYGGDCYRMRSETIPESAVAYDEAFVRQLIANCGLELSGPPYYGVWSGRADGLSYQDILLVKRRQPREE